MNTEDLTSWFMIGVALFIAAGMIWEDAELNSDKYYIAGFIALLGVLSFAVLVWRMLSAVVA